MGSACRTPRPFHHGGLPGANGELWLEDDGLKLLIADRTGDAGDGAPAVTLALSFSAANPAPEPVACDRVDVRGHYLVGRGAEGWRRGVPAWGGGRYVDLYPGVDLYITTAETYGRHDSSVWRWRLVCVTPDCALPEGRV